MNVKYTNSQQEPFWEVALSAKRKDFVIRKVGVAGQEVSEYHKVGKAVRVRRDHKASIYSSRLLSVRA